jgi:hypothetical protein
MPKKQGKPPKTKTPNRRRESYRPVTKPITEVEYGGLQAAYDYFKEHLFKERWLPDVMIVLTRKAHSAGHFAPDRFAMRADGKTQHELSLNPDGWHNKPDRDACQTLCHEMTHVWQEKFGTPAKRAYHNREWAAKMESIGLMPSNTGMPGGKRTGQHMSDYVIRGGAFEQVFAELERTGWKLNLESAPRPGKEATSNSKVKFTCPKCAQNAWGKPTLEIACIPCRTQMLPEDRGYDQQRLAA